MSWFDQATAQASIDALSKTPMLMPEMLNGVIGSVEVIAAFLLILGFAVRWISLPLLALMGFSILLAIGSQDPLVASEQMLMSHGYTDATGDRLTVSVMYFIMVLSLFFMGAGRFFSIDWFLYRKLKNSMVKTKKDDNVLDDEYDDIDPFEIDSSIEKKKAPDLKPAELKP